MNDVVEKLLTSGSFTREDFFRLYRLLCKNTHPDLTGKDGSEFIRLQQVYEQVTQSMHSAASFTFKPSFDPYRIIQESGYPKPEHSRTALFISLQRYMGLGLHTHKIRSKALSKEPARQVIRTILYWANHYDNRFVKVFVDFNKNKFEQIQINEKLKNGLKGRRYFFNGLNWFLKYQETGRSSAAHIAREKLHMAIYLVKDYGENDTPLVPFAEWLLEELRHNPVVFSD
jgi:hypothetical protein